MNSKERHELRYQRRKAAREQKRKTRLPVEDCVDLITFENLVKATDKCKKGVSWKPSVISYTSNTCINAVRIKESIKSRKYRHKKFVCFRLVERGKVRDIKAPSIRDRVLQRCMCDNILIPAVEDSLVYDNSANIKGKGTSFSERRFVVHLHKHFRKYGRTGGILFFDFKNYFGNVEQERNINIFQKYQVSEYCISLLREFICDETGIGIGLGQQPSQISGVLYPNNFDHEIKEKWRCKFNGRFMDDGYIILPSLNALKVLKKKIIDLAARNGIHINYKKLQIVRLTDPIVFLKKRFRMTDTGKVIMKQKKGFMRKERIRLRKYKHLMDEGIMTFKQILQCFKSFYGTIPKKMKYARKEICEYFNKLFVNQFVEGLQYAI